jgi:CRISPR-associated protein Cas7/Cse4/CasC subtype I-E
LIAAQVTGKTDVKKRAAKILEKCGIKPKDETKSDMLVYTSQKAITQMAHLLQESNEESDDLATAFGDLISKLVVVPDMALSGRMLETGVLKDTTVDAALQVAHAISTHEARPEVDYYVAADDIPGDDAGAGYVDEAMFASACFYKYFSIHWGTLIENLRDNKELAAHTVGAFLRGAALANPTGKQNSFAAHNPPDGMLVEIKESPTSYANAFADPVQCKGQRDMISQSIAQLGQYIHDLDCGYGKPGKRFWFSPNLRHALSYMENDNEQPCTDPNGNARSLDELVEGVIKEIGFNWAEVQTVTLK